jgi:DNA-binding response OmpR family regulator
VGRGRTLLLLGEDALVAHRLEQTLETYRVVPVAEPDQVPSQAADLHAVAVLANPLRNRQGWERLRQLGQGWGECTVPVILCPLLDEHRLSEDLGVADYLIKPVSQRALRTVLERLGEGVRRILIVEDDPQMVRVLMRIIGSDPRGYEVVCAHDGAEGWRRMQQQTPDLVLLDLRLPEMDGPAVLAHMRRDEVLRRVPVVVITAIGSEGESQRRVGHTLAVYAPGGFTAGEALAYLRGILESAAASAPSARPDEAVEDGQKAGLGDGLAQVGLGAE